MTILDPHFDELATLKQELRLSEQDRFDLLVALNKFIDEACYWLDKNQNDYIQCPPKGICYVSGTCQTDLRAHLEKFINSYRTQYRNENNADNERV